mmetsp:Transcript_51919/g.52319  ORF Transcript_51919/g.52319 Transcript_51919/m.52319 type:complete len:85 (+) Transcript_51919:409-663(+)
MQQLTTKQAHHKYISTHTQTNTVLPFLRSVLLHYVCGMDVVPVHVRVVVLEDGTPEENVGVYFYPRILFVFFNSHEIRSVLQFG